MKKIKIIFYFKLFACLFCANNTVFPDQEESQNILKNNSFEEINNEDLPSEWNITLHNANPDGKTPEAKIISESCDGEYALQLISAMAFQTLSGITGRYKLSFSVNTLRTHPLIYGVQYRSKDGAFMSKESIQKVLPGPVGKYSNCSLIIEIPENAATAMILFSSHDAVIDNVSLHTTAEPMPQKPVILPVKIDADGNFLRNASFEVLDKQAVPEYWKVTYHPKNPDNLQPAIKNSANANEGTNAVDLISAMVSQEMSIVEGKYQLKFNVLKPGKYPLLVAVQLRNADGGLLVSNSMQTRVDAPVLQWTENSASFDVPASAATANILFSTHGAQIDDIWLGTNGGVSKTIEPKLVLNESFSGNALPENWKIFQGEWKVINGALFGDGRSSKGAVIHYTGNAGRNIRVEYTAWATDAPCDLSVIVSCDPAKAADILSALNGYLIGFGAANNTKNVIQRITLTSEKKASVQEVTRSLWEGFSTGIKQGVKHKLAAERIDGKINFFRDGKPELAGDDYSSDEVKGKSFGLYTWNSGYFDDIRVYALPESKQTVAPDEEKVSFWECITFSNEKPGMPSGMISALNKTNGAIISELENFEYQGDKGETFIFADSCLELDSEKNQGSPVTVCRRVERMQSGILEFDLLINKPGEIKLTLLNAETAELASLIVSAEGYLMSEGKAGIKPLLNKIEYRRRNLLADFRIMPNRWYTLRLHFDSKAGIIQDYAVVDLYKEAAGAHGYGRGAVDQGDYISLGGRINYKFPGDVSEWRLTAAGASCRIYLDNITILGPVGKKTVNKTSILFSSRNLLGLTYTPRRDLFNLKEWSLRHLDTSTKSYMTTKAAQYLAGTGDPDFYKAGTAYNEGAIRAAFIIERNNLLERSLFYFRQQSKILSEAEKTVKETASKITRIENLQESAMRNFARAYLDSSNKKLLTENYGTALSLFLSEVTSAENLLNSALKILSTQDTKSKKIFALPAELWKEPPVWDRSKMVWKYGGEDGFYFHSTIRNPEFAKPLGLWSSAIDVFSIAFYGQKINSGDFVDKTYADMKIAEAKKIREKYGKTVNVDVMMQTGCHYIMQSAPNWWFEQNQSDPDIFFTKNDGSAFPKKHEYAYPATKAMSLNPWNAKVKKLQTDHHGAVGRALREYAEELHFPYAYFGAEAYNELQDGQEPGHNPSAIQAFQNELKKKYSNLENLNKIWGSGYKSFSDILPPQYRQPSSPLQYEFQRFISIGYINDFLQPCISALTNGYGGNLAIAFDHQNSFGNKFDMPRLSESIDMQFFHTYQNWDRRIYPRWMNSLAQGAGKSWGTLEWQISQGLDVMFELDRIKTHGLREIMMQIMWGCSSPNIFMGMAWNGPGNWQYTPTLSDPRLGYLLYHYHAPFLRISIDRAKHFGNAALRFPVAAPDVAIFESEATLYNEYPAGKMRELIKNVSVLLEEKSWDYGYCYEKFLLEQKQSLKGIQTLIMPGCVCLGSEISTLLDQWVSGGGTMIAFEPPGILTELGLASGFSFIKIAFKDMDWTLSGTEWSLPSKKSEYENAGLHLYYAPRGKGKIFVFTSAALWNAASAKTAELTAQHTSKKIETINKDIALCLRESSDDYFLYAANLSLTDTAENIINLNFPCKEIIDEGLQLPLAVPFERDKNRTVFKTILAPGGMTLFRMSKEK